MKEQVAFSEAVLADLERLFPHYPPSWFTSNVASVKLGDYLTITMAPTVARTLIDAFVKSSS